MKAWINPELVSLGVEDTRTYDKKFGSGDDKYVNERDSWLCWVVEAVTTTES